MAGILYTSFAQIFALICSLTKSTLVVRCHIQSADFFSLSLWLLPVG